MSLYRDRAKCPAGHSFAIYRRATTAGKTVSTYCQACRRAYQIKAGQPKKEKA